MKQLAIIALIMFIVTSAIASPMGDALIQQGFKLDDGAYVRHNKRMNSTETILIKDKELYYKLELHAFPASATISEQLLNERIAIKNIAHNLIIFRLKALRLIINKIDKFKKPHKHKYEGAKNA